MKKLLILMTVSSVLSYSVNNNSLTFYNSNKKQIIKNIVEEKGDADIKSDGNKTYIPNVISYLEKAPKTKISGITEKEAKMRIALFKNIQKHLGKPYLWDRKQFIKI